MTDIATLATAADAASPYGRLTEPTTLEIQRLLPGPIERVWSYLTDSDLRRKWLAAGVMELAVGAPFELIWRNDELTDPPGVRPAGFGPEHRMASRILELEPPRKLVFSWGEDGGSVAMALEPRGERVLLTIVHRRILSRDGRLSISAGWHAHLDILAAKLAGTVPTPHWERWTALRAEYERRLPD